MTKKEWWEKGQHGERFNRARSAAIENQSAAKGDAGQTRPPTHGLQGGPTPPGNVRAEADKAARQQADKDRKLAEMRKKDDNEKGK